MRRVGQMAGGSNSFSCPSGMCWCLSVSSSFHQEDFFLVLLWMVSWCQGPKWRWGVHSTIFQAFIVLTEVHPSEIFIYLFIFPVFLSVLMTDPIKLSHAKIKFWITCTNFLQKGQYYLDPGVSVHVPWQRNIVRTHGQSYECLLKMPCISLQIPCDLPVAMVTMHFSIP